VRDYQGRRHTVTVAPEGYVWEGTSYSSLSAIARTITGTVWNGPRFFAVKPAPGNDPPVHGRRRARPPAETQLSCNKIGQKLPKFDRKVEPSSGRRDLFTFHLRFDRHCRLRSDALFITRWRTRSTMLPSSFLVSFLANIH
jgi:hypothetical protein